MPVPIAIEIQTFAGPNPNRSVGIFDNGTNSVLCQAMPFSEACELPVFKAAHSTISPDPYAPIARLTNRPCIVMRKTLPVAEGQNVFAAISQQATLLRPNPKVVFVIAKRTKSAIHNFRIKRDTRGLSSKITNQSTGAIRDPDTSIIV